MADPALMSPPTFSFPKLFHTVPSPLVFPLVQSVSSFSTSVLSQNCPHLLWILFPWCIFPISFLASDLLYLSFFICILPPPSAAFRVRRDVMFCKHTVTCITLITRLQWQFFRNTLWVCISVLLCVFQVVYVSIKHLFAIGEAHSWVCVGVNAWQWEHLYPMPICYHSHTILMELTQYACICVCTRGSIYGELMHPHAHTSILFLQAPHTRYTSRWVRLFKSQCNLMHNVSGLCHSCLIRLHPWPMCSGDTEIFMY